MPLIAIGIIVILATVAFIVLLAAQEHDKQTRKAKGLPPRKYHNVSDYDVKSYYVIEHHRK